MNHHSARCALLTIFAASACLAREPASNQSGAGARQFPSPQATLSPCQPPNAALFCEDLQEFITALNGETRDDGWAKPMEARIRKSMLVDGKPVATIASLQCRSTRCAVAYSLPAGDQAPQMDGDTTLDELMDLRTSGIAQEAAPTGAPRLVGVMAWQKRAPAPVLEPEPAHPGK
jgi:hypothetical protein